METSHLFGTHGTGAAETGGPQHGGDVAEQRELSVHQLRDRGPRAERLVHADESWSDNGGRQRVAG